MPRRIAETWIFTYRAAGLAVVWPQFIALGAIGSGLFGYALARFRSSIGSMT